MKSKYFFFVVVLTTTLVAITTSSAFAQSEEPRFEVLDDQFRIDDGELRLRLGYGFEYRHVAQSDISGGTGVNKDAHDGDYLFQHLSLAIGSEHKSWYWELFGEVDAWSWNDDHSRIQPVFLGGVFPAKRQEDRVGLELGFAPWESSFHFYVKGWYHLGDWQWDGSRGPEMQVNFGGGIRFANEYVKLDAFGGSDQARLYVGFPLISNGRAELRNPYNPNQFSPAEPATVETGPYIRGQYTWHTFQIAPVDWTRVAWFGEVGWELQLGTTLNLRIGGRYSQLIGSFEGVAGDDLEIGGWGGLVELEIQF